MAESERRATGLIAGLAVLILLLVVWDVTRRGLRRSPAPEPAASDSVVVVESAAVAPVGRRDSAAFAVTPPPPPVSPAGRDEPGFLELAARAETRRRIRASAGVTYLNEIVAAGTDSMLHRWDNRITNPVRVWLVPTTAANYRPAFLDAVRRAFQRWEATGLPVHFRLDADSTNAEVRLGWRIQFEMERTGQTDLTWDENGHLVEGTLTLATFDPKGQPMGEGEIYVVALHEIGHLLGLDHSPDSADLMYPVAKVRELSERDIRTALLLYQLTPGSLR